MKTRGLYLPAIAMLAMASPSALSAREMRTAFTYQGQLKQGDDLVNGPVDFQFSLWDADNGGNQIGDTLVFNGQPSPEGTNPAIVVDNGLFTVLLNFGEGCFTGQARWLKIEVRIPHDPNDAQPYFTFDPRQELTPTPYALALPGLWTQQNATCPNLIGGYRGNAVDPNVVGATIAGGGETGHWNRVLDHYGTIGGGADNQAGNTGDPNGEPYVTIGGGRENVASWPYATIGGGYHNLVTGKGGTIGGGEWNGADYRYATVGGGQHNLALAPYATIGGGGTWDPNDPSTYNRVTDKYGAIGGGGSNRAGDDNGDPDNAPYATVGGGAGNWATGGWSTVAGGTLNLASGSAPFYSATVGGGSGNSATGSFSTVPGGSDNTAAGDYSFAAGSQAKANHKGVFVWADSEVTDFISTDLDQFLVRAAGGAGFGTNDPKAQIHANGTGFNAGVLGTTTDATLFWTNSGVAGATGAGLAVSGYAKSGAGVYGTSWGGPGVYGEGRDPNDPNASNYGVFGKSDSPNGYGIYCQGVVGATIKAFVIDHPLDPANKVLKHYCAEGPEPLNVYSGTVVLDVSGQAWVVLPDYFEAINRDYRYQLTPIGAAMPDLHVGEEIKENSFLIAGGEPGMKVSWEVKGVRDDPYVRTRGAPVERLKPVRERGKYIYPELYGQPEELGVHYQPLKAQKIGTKPRAAERQLRRGVVPKPIRVGGKAHRRIEGGAR